MMASIDSEPSSLECSICQELFDDPKILPCAHLLCRKCLVTLIKPDKKPMCPLCLAVIFDEELYTGKNSENIIDTLPTDHSMVELINCRKVLNKRHVCCVHNDTDALTLCLHCNDMLCQSCVNVHGKLSVSRHHEVRELATLTPEMMASFNKESCSSHTDEPSKLFCLSHGVSICLFCSSSTHRSCPEVISLDQKLENSKRALSEMEQKLSVAEYSIMQAIKESEELLVKSDQSSMKTYSDIDKVFDNLQSCVETCRQRLKQHVRDKGDRIKATVNENTSLLKYKRGRILSHRLVIHRVRQTVPRTSAMISVLSTRLANLDLKHSLPTEVETIGEDVFAIDEEKIACIKQCLTTVEKKQMNSNKIDTDSGDTDLPYGQRGPSVGLPGLQVPSSYLHNPSAGDQFYGTRFGMHPYQYPPQPGSMKQEGGREYYLKVTELPSQVTEQELHNYFQDRKQRGGGPVERVVFNSQENMAAIYFTDTEVVNRVISRAPLLMKGKLIHVEVGSSNHQEESQEEIRTVEVRGLDEKIVEIVSLYFENPRKGGGDIEDRWWDNNKKVLYIIFNDAKVAETVCDRQHTICGREVEVTLHRSQVSVLRQKSREEREEQEEQEEAQPRMIQVTVGQQIQSEDIYLFYFENKRRGGGEVEKIEIIKEKGLVFVTFVSPEVAEQIVNRQHTIYGQAVDVKLYIPPKPRPTYKNRLLMENVKETNEGSLLLFIEYVTGCEPTKVVYGEIPGVVLASFKEELDFANAEEKCLMRTLAGNRVSVSKVPISNCLLVENLNPITTEDTLAMYFENTKRSHGGPVERVEMVTGENKCLIYFEDYTVIDDVLIKTPTIDHNTLALKRYFECLGPSGGSLDGNTSLYQNLLK